MDTNIIQPPAELLARTDVFQGRHENSSGSIWLWLERRICPVCSSFLLKDASSKPVCPKCNIPKAGTAVTLWSNIDGSGLTEEGHKLLGVPPAVVAPVAEAPDEIEDFDSESDEVGEEIAEPIFEEAAETLALDPYPSFPDELKKLPRWSAYNLVWNEEKKKNDKPPFNVRTGQKGNPIVAADQATYEEVATAIAAKQYSGAGFGIVYEDGITGTDFDDCVNPETREIRADVKQIIAETNSYAEFSPSMTGVHVWTKGWQVPKEGERQGRHVGGAEIYSGKHYLTVTGLHIPGTPLTVESRDLSRLYARILAGEFPKKNLPSIREINESHIADDRDEKYPIHFGGKAVTTKLALLLYGEIQPDRPTFVVEDAFGNFVDYPSQSEAVMSLVTLLARNGKTAQEIDAAFRESPLYSGKWSAGKWDRLAEDTIKKAMLSAEQWKLRNAQPQSQTQTQIILDDDPGVTTAPITLEIIDQNSPEAIPPFDPSVMSGIYKKFVDLITRGTTLCPQYAFVIAKTIVGARMAGRTKFKNLDAEPRYYAALIGETGAGKGEAWRRAEKILLAEGLQYPGCGIKFINSADSGAGIKDIFLDPPTEWPVLCYIDEMKSLGNKAASTRNPAILDTMFELADRTSISWVKVNRNAKEKTEKTKHDARFSMVMCGQNREVYAEAFAGRTQLGIYDRVYPEFNVPVEGDELPEIDNEEAVMLMVELNSLKYDCTMEMSEEAKARLKEFWKQQPAEIRKRVRLEKHLKVDAFMAAFGRGSTLVEIQDAETAIKICSRQLVIRRVFFGLEIPDRVGFYLDAIKRVTEIMERELAAGKSEAQVARSRRDYETATNAFRNNDLHIFEKAWNVYWKTHLRPIELVKANGQKYQKFLPEYEEREAAA